MDILEDQSSEDGEYMETEQITFNIKCLFCDFYSHAYDLIFDHIKNEHRVDFIQKCKQNQLDTFQFIKIVNYIRKTNVDVSCFENVLQNKPFECDIYLKPCLEDDHFLMFDYEGEVEKTQNLNTHEKSEDELRKLYENSSKDTLIQKIIDLTKQLKEAKICADKLRNLLIDNSENHVENINNVTSLVEESDLDYIDFYSHFSIHHTMLADKARTLAYQDAILENSSFFKDKTVLDIGCGAGILSLFAAKAGAKLVVAVDQSNIIYNAKSIIYENGYYQKVMVIKGKLEKLDFEKLNLPTKYDIIISEWMGYFLLFEGMLETILFARNRLLQNNGVLLPNRCKIFLSAFSDCKFYEKNIDFWKDVYGFNMSSMIANVTNEATIDLIHPENICATSAKICDFNISTCSNDFIRNISSPFELKFKNDSTIHGFVGWFDCNFESMSKLIILSTSPFSEATHWKQTIFPLKEPILIKSGQTIQGEINIKKNSKNPRSLHIRIFLKQENLKLDYNIC